MTSDDGASEERSAGARPRTLGLGGFVVELLLPTVLSAALLLVAARYLPWWNLRARLGIVAFGVLLVLLSLVLSIRIDGWTLPRRQRVGRSQLLNRAGAKARLVKFVLGGIVVPLAAFEAANLVKLPDRRTPMTVAAEISVRTPEAPREARIGDVVLRSGDSAVKVAGLSALQAVGSDAALDQLLRILAEDRGVLEGGAEAQALAKAIASYGKAATPRLQAFFEKVGHDAPAPPPAAPGGTDRASLAMQALLEMSPAEAAEALPFARAVAVDAACSEDVRGRALLLVARLGGEKDLEFLYASLDGPSPLLQARALEAIAALSARLSPRREGAAKAP